MDSITYLIPPYKFFIFAYAVKRKGKVEWEKIYLFLIEVATSIKVFSLKPINGTITKNQAK